MSIFSSIGSFFKKLFSKLRPGLDVFLQKYKDIAVKEVLELTQVHSGKDFHEWRDQAWEKVKTEVTKDGKEVAGNWITLIIALAFEEIKASANKK